MITRDDVPPMVINKFNNVNVGYISVDWYKDVLNICFGHTIEYKNLPQIKASNIKAPIPYFIYTRHDCYKRMWSLVLKIKRGCII